MVLIRFYLFLYLPGLKTFCAPISEITSEIKYPQLPSTNVLEFMKKYGYIEEDDGTSEALYTEDGLSKIIKSMQKFGAIDETGKIDNKTLQLMTSRRCGVRDIIRHKREKRFIVGSEGWEKRNITYYVVNWSSKLSEYTVVKNIQRALDTWGGYGRLYFRRTSNPDADILVTFARGYHGDEFPFDGTGNVLAHAFFPQKGSHIGGDIHFDEDENWIDKNENPSEDGTDFYAVALHELGHSLGLAHSPVPSAVMFPYYRYSDSTSEIQLDYDDILGMYKLYINRILKEDYDNPSTSSFDDHYETMATTTSSPTTHLTDAWTSLPITEYSTFVNIVDVITTNSPTSTEVLLTTTETDIIVTYEGDDEYVDDHKQHDNKHNIPATNFPSFPNICDGFVDAVATLREELFVFRDQFIWRYREKGKLLPGYPITLTQMFPELPKTIKKIDAAYERLDGMIIIFTGKSFWVYDGTNFHENSPRPLRDYGLPDYLNDIDAVQVWGRNRKTYFYKNDRFWRYNEVAKTMDRGYPLHMEKWRGVPENLSAATTWKDGVTYFFKWELFWKFDNDWVITTEQSPFPTAQIWFGCPEEEQQMKRLFSYNFQH